MRGIEAIRGGRPASTVPGICRVGAAVSALSDAIRVLPFVASVGLAAPCAAGSQEVPSPGPVPVGTSSTDRTPDDLIASVSRTFSVRGGLLFTEHRTIARVDSEALGRGTTVEVERELGLSEWTRDVRLDGALRLGRRHQLQAGYLALTRTGRTDVGRRIQFGDAVFDVAVGVESAVDVVLLPVTYRFSAIRSDRFDVGLSAGVFALFLDAAVEARDVGVGESGSADFPLPVVGIDAIVALLPGLYGSAGFKYFRLEVSGIDGEWREVRAAVEYFPVRHFGIGAGYRFVSLEADGTGGIIRHDEGSLLFLDYEFQGPHVYLALAF